MLALMFSSCKKENSNTTSEDAVTSAGDVASISAGVDATGADAVAAETGVGAAGQASGKVESYGPHNPWATICGSTTVDNGTAPNKTITITYDGTTKCHGLIRSGIVTIDNLSGIDWNKANAQLTLTYHDLKITDVSTGDYHILNGTHVITNMTGGTFWKVVAQEVPSGTTVTHKNVSTNMQVTFSDGTTRSYSFDRMRSWNLTNMVITETTFADGNNYLEQGVGRNGKDFTDQITSPIIDNNYCQWNPYTGTVVHAVTDMGPTTTMYGTDSQGKPDGGPQTCAQGYYITVNGGKGPNKFVAYPSE